MCAADDASAFTVIVIASVDVVVNAFNTDAAPLVTVAVTTPLALSLLIVFISVTVAVPLSTFTANVLFATVVIPLDASAVVIAVDVPVNSVIAVAFIDVPVNKSIAFKLAADVDAAAIVTVIISELFVDNVFNVVASCSVTTAVTTPVTADTLFILDTLTLLSVRVTFPAPVIDFPDVLDDVVVKVTSLFTTTFEFPKSPVNVEFPVNLTVSLAGVVSCKILE